MHEEILLEKILSIDFFAIVITRSFSVYLSLFLLLLLLRLVIEARVDDMDVFQLSFFFRHFLLVVSLLVRVLPLLRLLSPILRLDFLEKTRLFFVFFNNLNLLLRSLNRERERGEEQSRARDRERKWLWPSWSLSIAQHCHFQENLRGHDHSWIVGNTNGITSSSSQPNRMTHFSFYALITFTFTLIFGNSIISLLLVQVCSFVFLLVRCDKTNELYTHLMSNYNKNVRPVRNNSDLVNVKLGLKLIQIADVVRISIEHSIILFLLFSPLNRYLLLHDVIVLLEGKIA